MTPPHYIAEIKQIIISARNKTYTAINSAMIEAYWFIGKRIVEEEQNGKQRVEYGQEIIKTLSKELKNEFGTHCVPNLTWTHYRQILRLSDKNAKQYYITEASENNWSVRTLERNISAMSAVIFKAASLRNRGLRRRT
jgi:predicted nuclease of restriction endonuclease-like (RecB) superfamily